MADSEVTERSTAELITAVVADRVRWLRERSGMSQAELAEQMTELGTPWKRATVVNLEKRGTTTRKKPGTAAGRDAVTVQELLTLALVLHVPPVWLLTDPTSGAAVPVTAKVKLPDSWSALLWMVGQDPLHTPAGPAWEDASALLGALQRLAATLKAYDQQRDLWAKHDNVVPPQEDVERSWLKGIGDDLEVFRTRRWPVPPVPDHVRPRAAELGIDLPGQEG